jgi:hypothetical protein
MREKKQGINQEGDAAGSPDPCTRSRLRRLRCLCTVRQARTLTPRTASLSFFSRTPILAFTRAVAGGRDDLGRAAAGTDSSSTLWIRYCALRRRASSASALSTFAYANAGAVFSSSIFFVSSQRRQWRSRTEEGALWYELLLLLAVAGGGLALALDVRAAPVI